MAYAPQQHDQDHWSLNLRVKRPGRVPLAALVVAVIQTLLLAATASALGTGGGLYGCTSDCGTADAPATPPIAIALGIVILVLPVVIGALCADWQLSVALAVLPVFPAFLIASSTLLVPTNTIVPPQPATGTQPAVPYATSHFGLPFFLDPAHLTPLLFSLALFAVLGWLGWVIASFFKRQP
jgi:hypothetical protein